MASLWLLLVAILAASFEGLARGKAVEKETIEFNDPIRAEMGRRLEAVIEERTSFKRHEPHVLEKKRLLPALKVGRFRLAETYVTTRKDPWTVHHAKITEAYEAKDRRLGALDNVLATEISFETPRSRVRTFAYLNAGVRYGFSYNWSYIFPLPETIYEDQKQLYWTAETADLTDPEEVALKNKVGNATEESNGTLSDVLLAAVQKQDMTELTEGATKARSDLGSSISKDYFVGEREDTEAGLDVTDPEQIDDVGVSVSVYTDDDNIVLVYHNGYTEMDWWYINELHRLWILERYENAARIKWTYSALQSVQEAMLTRRAEDDVERHIRCAFKDYRPMQDMDMESLAKAADVSSTDLLKSGLWVIVKKVTREILPQDRDKVTAETYYLTGTGTGGMHAAWASMWLEKADDVTYPTYIISGVGFECAARRLLTSDMSPWSSHDSLYVYAHAADFIATAVDRIIGGSVCLFGAKNFSKSQAFDYCARAIGHSGPELFYRGPQPTTSEEVPTEEMLEGQAAFDACHYYTHSIWYAAMLMENEEVLMLDGTTDGGCSSVDGISKTDSLDKCPLSTTADTECDLLNVETTELPYGTLAMTSIIMISVLCFFGLSGISCLTRVTDDSHLFKEDDNSSPTRSWPFCCLPASTDDYRAKEARKRAREKQAREFQKKYGISNPGDEDEEGANKEKKTKRKKKGPKKGLEAFPLVSLPDGIPEEEAGDLEEEEESSPTKDKKEKKAKKDKAGKTDDEAEADEKDKEKRDKKDKDKEKDKEKGKNRDKDKGKEKEKDKKDKEKGSESKKDKDGKEKEKKKKGDAGLAPDDIDFTASTDTPPSRPSQGSSGSDNKGKKKKKKPLKTDS